MIKSIFTTQHTLTVPVLDTMQLNLVLHQISPLSAGIDWYHCIYAGGLLLQMTA